MRPVLRLRRRRRFCGHHVAGLLSRADNDPLNKVDPLGLSPTDTTFSVCLPGMFCSGSITLGGGGPVCSVDLPGGTSIDLPSIGIANEWAAGQSGLSEGPCSAYRFLSGLNPLDDVPLPPDVRQASRKVMDFIEFFEIGSWASVTSLVDIETGPYLDLDPESRACTIGIGELAPSASRGSSAPEDYALFNDIAGGDGQLSYDEARRRFTTVVDVKGAQPVRDAISWPLTQCQFDALVSYSYQIGSPGTNQGTKINNGDLTGGLAEFTNGTSHRPRRVQEQEMWTSCNYDPDG